ncbi:MAG: hypothetical protein M3020_11905 [Myxococcota bacterium]|nr:hypothetical protein [Myxococcota bacterium]
MDIAVLIDAIVRQTTVLIAQLATSAGGRAPLAHTANQVFVDLVRELKEQGLGNKVIADMFGMALRTYHWKVRRLGESSTFRGRSLWASVLEYLQDRETVLHGEVLHRFRYDDEASVRGVLNDLVDSGMVFRTGSGARKAYRAAKPEEYQGAERDAGEGVANFVWVAVSRFGPLTEKALADVAPLDATLLSGALERLVKDRRVARVERGGEAVYSCDQCVIPLGSAAGWEAAVFDHYQAMVTAICTKLRLGAQASAGEQVGGSTYGFLIWEGHEYEQEVRGLLAELRSRAAELRSKVTEYNERNKAPPDTEVQVIAYVGQTVIEADSTGEDS